MIVETVDLERLKRFHAAVAKLARKQPSALPIFARLDAELIEATLDPVERARGKLMQSQSERAA